MTLTVCAIVFGASFQQTQAPADPTLAEWEANVKEAAGLPDETRRRDAQIALVRQALGAADVRLSGTSRADEVHPDDNQPAPAINFDPRLNEKRAYRSSRELETNTAYYFVAGGLGYIVLGPRALDPRSPVFTRMLAEHESFHAKRHIGDPRPLTDRELETWTHVFVTFFHEVYPFKQRWAPLVSNYETADPGEQKATLDRLVGYYKAPPGDEPAKAAVRVAFDEWLERRRKDARTSASKLVAHLDRALAPAKR